MSSPVEIIEAIKALPPEQRAKMVRFAVQYEPVRLLSPEELGEIAERLAASIGSEEVAAPEKEMVNGFYGAKLEWMPQRTRHQRHGCNTTPSRAESLSPGRLVSLHVRCFR